MAKPPPGAVSKKERQLNRTVASQSKQRLSIQLTQERNDNQRWKEGGVSPEMAKPPPGSVR